MAGIFAFTCACCGKVHEGSPSFAFNAPWHYSTLSDEQKRSMGMLDSDLCTINHAEGTDYFIRAILEIPIHSVEEPFIWGVWVSLSEKSYSRYVDTYDNPIEGDGFFGWLCNRLPCYPDTLALAANVHVQMGGKRPTVRLHRGNSNEHPLVRDQHQGIGVKRAQEIAEQAMHGRSKITPDAHSKLSYGRLRSFPG
jgi:hypothetical protein